MKKGEIILMLGVIGVVGVVTIIFMYGKYILMVLGAILLLALVVGLGRVVAIIYKKRKEDDSLKSKCLTFTHSEQKHLDFVKKHSNVYSKLILLNKKYSFYKIQKRDYVEICLNLNSYKKINEDEYLKEKIKQNFYWIEADINAAEENLKLWNAYQNECKKIEIYLTKEEIKQLPNRKLRIKVFERIERKLYLLQKLPKPDCAFQMSLKASYTSPQGRNSYAKDAFLSHNDIKRLLPAIKIQIEEETQLREQIEREKALKKWEKTQKYQERKEFTEAKNRRRHLELNERERKLDEKEREFKEATSGHIYSTSPALKTEVVKTEATSMPEAEVSMWVKLKRLKSQFDNGEITYVEYEKKRKELL